MKWTCLVVLFGLLSGFGAPAQAPRDSEVFKRVFGVSRFLPMDLVEQVKALPPGKKLERDTNNDGHVDELWYIDAAKRHTISPILVRVIDEDGDMRQTGRGDLDSDLYFWDYGADGYMDAVTDYQDNDHDGDVDQMGIFFDKRWPDEKDGLTVWWAVDVGDDNLLWYDVNGNYDQPLCQWRTHFSGDELFYQFRLTADSDKWLNVWEDPFAFYDPDGDRCSEVVVRISAIGADVQNLRYSFDADDDARGPNTHNYDFSITALPPAEGLPSANHGVAPLLIRGIETQPVLRWDATQDFARNAPWGKAMLTWDEINSNTDGNIEEDPNERWEGILNHASKNGDFPQVGGPPCSAFNKRVEVSQKPTSPLRLYLDESDHRLHLIGAAYGYLDVDYNLDGAPDAAYAWRDDNGDGVLDHRTADVDGDGAVDFECAMTGIQRTFDLEYDSFARFYPNYLRKLLEENQRFIDVALACFERVPASVSSVIDFYAEPLTLYRPEREIGPRIQNSPAGSKFYSDLARDRLFVELRRVHHGEPGWSAVEDLFQQGRYTDAGEKLAGLLKQRGPNSKTHHPFVIDGKTYSRRMAVEVDNPGRQPRDAWPVVIAAKDLQERAADFSFHDCAVVDGDFWLAWREIPHQIDDWDFTGEPQLSFLADVPARTKKTFYVYYDPQGARQTAFPLLTRAVLDTPAYVAWESDAGAYRFYTGQFDFFGKQEGRLLPREKRLLYPILGGNYHAEQDWGMDALHVNKTSGLGGLTLYVGGKEYLVQSPAGEGHVQFEHRVLGGGPVRSAVEITARNVIPEMTNKVVKFRCFIYARHPESEIRVLLPEGLSTMRLAPGLLRLTEDHPFSESKLACMGTWGYQSDEIGEIGLGVIVPAAQVGDLISIDSERRLRCKLDGNQFHYWIIGAWRRGMQYPVAPTVDNWKRAVADLATELDHPLRIHPGS